MNTDTRFVELDSYQFIKIGGPDCKKFLQGQLSCNMDLLSTQRSLRGAICNLKGRVIADVRVLQSGNDCLLQVGPNMANVVVTTLSKYAIFSKVKLEIQDAHPAPLGIIGELPPQLLQLFPEPPNTIDGVCQIEDASLIRIAGTEPRFELWFNFETSARQFRAAIPTAQRITAAAWQRADIAAGIVHVDPTITEEFTPQLLNYDISGVIDFKKGCYTGQEVVARMFYRGIAKKRLYLASTSNKIDVEDTVHMASDADDKNTVILAFSNAARESDEANLLLTILGTDAVESGTRFTLADQPDAELTILPLQY